MLHLRTKISMYLSRSCLNRRSIPLISILSPFIPFEGELRRSIAFGSFTLPDASSSGFRRKDSAAHQERLAAVMDEIDRRGTYELTENELSFGGKTSWRNATRCIGRMLWNRLQVCNRRKNSDFFNIIEGSSIFRGGAMLDNLAMSIDPNRALSMQIKLSCGVNTIMWSQRGNISALHLHLPVFTDLIAILKIYIRMRKNHLDFYQAPGKPQFLIAGNLPQVKMLSPVSEPTTIKIKSRC